MQNFDERIDNWTLGIVLYIMISGRFPFAGKNKKDVLKSISMGMFTFNHPPFQTASTEVKDLIAKLLTRNPNDRYTAFEALKHPFLNSEVSEDDPRQRKIDSQVLDRLHEYSYFTKYR